MKKEIITIITTSRPQLPCFLLWLMATKEIREICEQWVIEFWDKKQERGTCSYTTQLTPKK